MSSLREATIEAQRAGAVRHQQQEATGDRDVLEEHDHLDLVGEVAVENQRAQQRVASEQKALTRVCQPRMMAIRAEHFGGDDDRKQNAGHTDRRHIRRCPCIGADLADAGQQEQQRTASCVRRPRKCS